MSKQKTYSDLRRELEEILAWFEGEDVDVDQAITKHAEAEELIKQLEAFLKDAKLKIQQR